MRSNCGIYVDAGYLLAAAATRVTGTSLRSGITAKYPTLLAALMSQAETLTGLPVLRVNWYDAAQNGVPDYEQEQIGLLPKVKLRLGRFGFDGQQKGVDIRMGLDMVAHALHGAVDTIVLVSGDDDLTEAVEDAQVQGVEVILLAVPNIEGRPHGVSRHLQLAADSLEMLNPADLEAVVHRSSGPEQDLNVPGSPTTPTPVRVPTPASVAQMARARPVVSVAYTGTTGATSTVAPEYAHPDEETAEAINEVAMRALTSFLGNATGDDLAAFEFGRPSIPRDLDRALLFDLSEALSTYNPTDGVRTQLRRRFWEIADERVG